MGGTAPEAAAAGAIPGADDTASAGNAPGEKPEAEDLLRDDVRDDESLLPALGNRGACMWSSSDDDPSHRWRVPEVAWRHRTFSAEVSSAAAT